MITLFALVVVLSGVVALARFRSFDGLRTFECPRSLLVAIIGAGVIQIAASRLPESFRDRHGFAVALTTAAVVTLCLVIALVAVPLLRRGVSFVLLGWLLNAIAILANDGMPVDAAAAQWMGWDPAADPLSNHVLESATTTFGVLGDQIALNLVVERTVVSVGDLLLLAGFAAVVIDAMRTQPTRELELARG